jgi:hypothetical protein
MEQRPVFSVQLSAHRVGAELRENYARATRMGVVWRSSARSMMNVRGALPLVDEARRGRLRLGEGHKNW